ncbi:MAG: GNAT family N-acetyltransferase [Pseudomonadota bacterium]|nr:GNAT family N-acetyltransferase [Pseudomonadota bacterium]
MLADVWKDLKVEVVSARDVASLAAAWAKLANSAQEPSSLQLPEMQLPLMAQNTEAKLLTVSKCDELLLALPVQSSRNFDRSTASDFDCNSLPLVASSHPQEAVLAMVQNLKRPLLLKDLPLESRFFGQLQMTGAHVRFTQQWQRAALLVNGSFEEWLARNFDHKRRKEFKRLRKRLSEQGELKLESLNPNSNFTTFVEDFVQLEAQGWKGQRGTALGIQDGKTSTFRQICEGLHYTGRLRFWVLRFNSRPIAALFGVVCGTQAQIIKIAYDESFAKYSPGVLLVLDATQAFFAEPDVELVDSCAIPDHPMINRIWRDRIGIGDVLVAPAHYPAWKFNKLFIGLSGYIKLRGLAKKIYLTLTRRKKS